MAIRKDNKQLEYKLNKPKRQHKFEEKKDARFVTNDQLAFDSFLNANINIVFNMFRLM